MGFLIDTGCFHRTGKHLVQWVHVKKKNAKSRGVIFAPPLIGAGSSLEISNLRRLARNGYELFSFNYSGHGQSSDKFRPRATLEDTSHALDFLIRRSGGKPVHSIASCYSAIPLLHAAHSRNEPLKKIVLINAVCHINPKAIVSSFVSHYRDNFSENISVENLNRAFKGYMSFLFPGIEFNHTFFGTLLRQRTDVLRTLWDAFFLDPLQSVRLNRTPVLSLYATEDRILKIYDSNVGENYEKQILQKCPRTTFLPLPCDHFLSSGRSRETAYKKIMDFLE